MALDETRTAGESGHLSDHNSLHDFYNAAVDAGAFDEATGTYKDTSPFPPATFHPSARTGGAALGSADRCYYHRITLGGGIEITSLAVVVGTSSGNISLAHLTGPVGRNGPDTRIATTGSVACPASGYAAVSLGGATTPSAGDWFALSADNNTATFDAAQVPIAGNAIGTGFSAIQETAHPVPASPSSLTHGTLKQFIIVGVE